MPTSYNEDLTNDLEEGQMIAKPMVLLKTVVLISSLICVDVSFAKMDTSEAAIQKLIDQVEALTLRVTQLEAAQQMSDTSLVENNTITEKISSPDRVIIKGDFRLRYENIGDVTKTESRDRSRIRARIELIGQVSEDWSVGLGLASGGDDPVSTNQTLGNGGTTKGINLDLAYFDWSGLTNTHLLGGKFKNPFYKPAKNSLIWDSDYRPEGLAYKYASDKYFVNAAFMFLESDNKAGTQNTETLWGTQVGLKTKWGANNKLTAGLSYYNINVAGSKAFYDADLFGNSVINNGTDDLYLHDYQELELFSEFSFNVGNLPASVFIDWVQNQSVDDNGNGYSIGASLGSAKNPRAWKASYIYQDLESDAVLGLTTDSDFGGGGTNVSGHLFKAAYAIQKNVSFGLTYLINQQGDLETDYDRLQLDFKLKY